uniref:Uncharacterized protein n=1 Tax=Chromera velia CCMP2878 TaxID=1169474 RepID=A0A0G4GGG7_9ALVE|eukprot:Cvel_21793.t1-p1 / transcript=Cvel_21793.t1 / gene=Cvel_21793 / organism=Chromera_velia_CCMP2878 / gene_product=hypothetical protein / transcript_product=hypothetical protein / location=Cvel_scaffold2076:13103-15454(+) / protein_length=361 / sequence_SO=supercontig / SO=protein_coding / is_pseudo=false
MSDGIPRVEFSAVSPKTLGDSLKSHGVVVIENVFSAKECDGTMDQIVSCFESLGTGIDRKAIRETWTDSNLPPQTRPGMFQSLLGNMQPLWKIRRDERVASIFHNAYTSLRTEAKQQYVISHDGFNVMPNQLVQPDQHWDHPARDWAHLDQTIRGDPYMCIQGQVVLTNTTAAFRCSPKSHLVYESLLSSEGSPEDDTSNWRRFNTRDEMKMREARRLIQTVGGQWQVPVYTPRGSVILWLSSVVHSAKPSHQVEEASPEDPYRGWRGVAYVCYRPADEFSPEELAAIERSVASNLLMNHWSTKQFRARGPKRFGVSEGPGAQIQSLLRAPQQLYTSGNPLYEPPEEGAHIFATKDLTKGA